VNLDRFVSERQASWAELRQLVATAKGRADKLGPDGIRRLGSLYRATAADLALARRRFPLDPSVPMLEDLVGRARHLVYAGEARTESLRGFLARRYWQRVAERPALLVLAAVLLFSPMVLGTVWGVNDPDAARGIVPGALAGPSDGGDDDADLGFSTAESTAFSTQIFVNNIRVSFLALAGGISAGLLTAGALLFNGVLLGVVTGLAVDAGSTGRFVQLVVPHGVLELSCIVVAGASGLRIASALVAPGRRRRSEALVREARPAVEVALGTALWLVLAGIVEGFITPEGIGVGPALVFGLGLGALYWGLVWRLGHRAGPVTAAPAT
jgi:uncharacterized membrane protein SpoIIM required for sporulation